MKFPQTIISHHCTLLNPAKSLKHSTSTVRCLLQAIQNCFACSTYISKNIPRPTIAPKLQQNIYNKIQKHTFHFKTNVDNCCVYAILTMNRMELMQLTTAKITSIFCHKRYETKN